MKVVVLGGAGGMGQYAVRDLSLNSFFEEIVVADANEDALQSLVLELDNEKISTVKIDITNEEQLKELLTGAAVTLNFIGPFYKFGPLMIEAAIEAKSHYVDICDDFDAAEAILAMDEKAKEAGLTVLTGMGASPGMTNIFAKLGIETLDEVEEIDTIWVMGAPETGSAVLYHLLHSATGKVPSYDKGKRTLIDSFVDEGSLTIDFPEPLGKVTVYDIGHPEPITIPKFYPSLKKVTNKGTFMPADFIEKLKVLLELGFASDDQLAFDQGVSLSPRDFTVQFLQEYFKENKQLSDGFGGLQVIVKGKKDNEQVTLTYTTVSNESTGASTGVPAATAAELIANGTITNRGVIAPEVLDPMQFLQAMASRKALNEDVKRTGVIVEQTFADGRVEVLQEGKEIEL